MKLFTPAAYLLLGSGLLHAQSNLSYPTNILPPADRSQGGEVRIFADDRTAYVRLLVPASMQGLEIVVPDGTSDPTLILTQGSTPYLKFDGLNSGAPVITALDDKNMTFTATATAVDFLESAFIFNSPSALLMSMYSTTGAAPGGWTFTNANFGGLSGTFPGTTQVLLSSSTGNISTSGDIVMYDGNGITGDTFSITSGNITSSWTWEPPSGGAPGPGYAIASTGAGGDTAWSFLFSDPMTTNGDIIYRSGGVPTRLGIGTNNYVLTSNGSAPTWAALPTPGAWTSYTPTVSASGTTIASTTSLVAAYQQIGKTVYVRVAWVGVVTAATTGIAFTTPVNPLTAAGSQALSVLVWDGSSDFVASAIVTHTINQITLTTGAGMFPGSPSTLTIYITGVYEAA